MMSVAITREILEARLKMYQQGQQAAIERLHTLQQMEAIKQEIAAHGGGIDCCENLLELLGSLEAAKEPGGMPDKEEPAKKK